METLLPVGVAAATLMLTYFTCIRPMRRGECLIVPARRPALRNKPSSEEISQLRTEVAALRNELRA